MQQHGVHGLSNKHALHTLHLARGRTQVENRVGHPGVVLEPAVGGACDQTGTGAVAEGLFTLSVALGEVGITHMLP